MKEVSNKTLAGLLIVAMVVFIGGTLLVVNNTGSKLTGAASTGLAKVNVTGVVAISLPVSVVDFGDIYQGGTKNTTTNKIKISINTHSTKKNKNKKT